MPVNSSWDDLTRAHGQVVEHFDALLRKQQSQVGILPPRNAVHVAVAPSVPEDARREIASFATDPKVKIAVEEAPEHRFKTQDVVCFYPGCERPLRAGVEIHYGFVGAKRCISEYVVGLPGASGTQTAVLTAGHCVNAWPG